jgi:hypothetical protein
MEKGFFHPSRGYWQTAGEPPKHVIDGYPEGTVEVPLKPGAGYEWDGSAWVYTPPDPAEAIATERAAMVVSRFQARAALLNAGLLDSVETALANADPFAKLAWADATEFRRNSPTIATLQSTIGLTDEQIDNLFRTAAQIEA